MQKKKTKNKRNGETVQRWEARSEMGEAGGGNDQRWRNKAKILFTFPQPG